MIPQDTEAKVVLSPVASATNADTVFSFDRGGYDRLNLEVLVGTHVTTTAVITGLQIVEHSSTTSASSMTAIAALCASDTTSTSAVNSLPNGASQGVGGIVTEFQLDLAARERYVGLIINTATDQTAVVSAIARLSRGDESRDTAAQKVERTNLAATSVSGCMQIIAG